MICPSVLEMMATTLESPGLVSYPGHVVEVKSLREFWCWLIERCLEVGAFMRMTIERCEETEASVVEGNRSDV